MAMFAHLLSLAGLIVPMVGSVGGPLVIWLLKKEESAYVDYHGKESVNFQISMLIYSLVAGALVVVLVGFLLLPAVLIANIILAIIAAMKASEGQKYKYPLTIRFIK
jgi:uncharacterized protein